MMIINNKDEFTKYFFTYGKKSRLRRVDPGQTITVKEPFDVITHVTYEFARKWIERNVTNINFDDLSPDMQAIVREINPDFL